MSTSPATTSPGFGGSPTPPKNLFFWLVLMAAVVIEVFGMGPWTLQLISHVISNLLSMLPNVISVGHLVSILALALLVDHGICHLRNRARDLKGHWYRWLALVVLALGLFCYAVHFLGYSIA